MEYCMAACSSPVSHRRQQEMPIPDYEGDTFVAFSDISGFKEMMKNDDSAVKALDHFYAAGFEILQNNHSVHGSFISDCAVLFVNNNEDAATQLQSLLMVVEQLNLRVLERNIMLTTSIARGRFSYHQRIEFEGINKNPIYGNAYVSALLDNESGTPRIQPGECRLVDQGLDSQQISSFPRLVKRETHFYFYWMVSERTNIDLFKRHYADAYQQKYRGMLEAIKDAVKQRF
jgi:hypothetical protein